MRVMGMLFFRLHHAHELTSAVRPLGRARGAGLRGRGIDMAVDGIHRWRIAFFDQRGNVGGRVTGGGCVFGIACGAVRFVLVIRLGMASVAYRDIERTDDEDVESECQQGL